MNRREERRCAVQSTRKIPAPLAPKSRQEQPPTIANNLPSVGENEKEGESACEIGGEIIGEEV